MGLTIPDLLRPVNNVINQLAITNTLKELFGLTDQTTTTNLHIAGATDHPGVASFKFDSTLGDPNHGVGVVHWHEGDGTLSFGLAGGTVELQVGQEQVVRVFNQTGSEVSNGEVCYLTDAGDQKPRIDLADASDESTVYVIGVATEDIAHGSQGYITTQGLVRDIDTSAITEGTPAYLSSSTPGAFIEDPPAIPNHEVRVGYCIRSHNNQGILLVFPHVRLYRDTKVLPETTTPTDVDSVGQVYCKSDNKLYFQDGAGVEHEIAFV